jgi:hypothetical protein
MAPRHFAIALAAASALALPVRAETAIDVMKDANCGCCENWIEHLSQSGFAPTGHDLGNRSLNRFKAAAGVPASMVSCHTATIDGYVIEGHVPAADIARLLDERPEAIGLAVPGMPMGSPGMEYGAQRDAFDVHLIRRDGSTEIFSSYAGN